MYDLFCLLLYSSRHDPRDEVLPARPAPGGVQPQPDGAQSEGLLPHPAATRQHQLPLSGQRAAAPTESVV